MVASMWWIGTTNARRISTHATTGTRRTVGFTRACRVPWRGWRAGRRLERRWAQSENQRTKLLQRLARQFAEALKMRSRGLWVTVELRRGGLRCEGQAEQFLADDVVQFKRQPVALREDRQLTAALYSRAFVIAIAACAASSEISSPSVASKLGAVSFSVR